MMFANLEYYLNAANVCGISGCYAPVDDSYNGAPDLKNNTMETNTDTSNSCENENDNVDEPPSVTQSHDDVAAQRPSTLLMPRSASEDPRRVRFAVDDERTKRKRRPRNLRKRIIQKSAEQRRQSSSGQAGDPPSPVGSSRRTVSSSSPVAHGRRNGRRGKRAQMASLIAPAAY